MHFQHTLKESVTFVGVGLHSGRPVRVCVRPAAENTGVVFHRLTQGGAVSIPAAHDRVVDTRLATVLGEGNVRISTVEHLLGALAACQIDNVNIDIDGDEVPIMDGSADEFMRAFRKTGLVTQTAQRQYLVIKRAITINDGQRRISLTPSDRFRVTFTISFDHPEIKTQSRSFNIDRDSFEVDIAPARTFGFLRDVEKLKEAGLAMGGSLENAIVVDDKKILNPEGLRFNDEFVRHKVLDIVGDLSLAGRPIIGHVIASRSGHDLNNKLLQKLFKAPDAWRVGGIHDMSKSTIGRHSWTNLSPCEVL